MKRFSLLPFLIQAVVVSATIMPHYDFVNVVEEPPSMCGFSASPQDRQMIRQIVAEEVAEDLLMHRRGVAPENAININTYIHLISESEAQKYNISDDTIRLQVDVLNKDYAAAGFSFNLSAITRSVNATWTQRLSVTEMRQVLHNGSWTDLNLYFMPSFPLFGVCSLPRSESDMQPENLHLDGCIIRSDTLPGAALPNYNLGRTAVHEVGHWLGLFHTFEGGCEGEGDFVEDTPAQGVPTGGCPESKDTCPDLPGLDPVHNFMDYSHDWCYTGFTPGQIRRMHAIWHKLRAKD